jgi:hypothetical protein
MQRTSHILLTRRALGVQSPSHTGHTQSAALYYRQSSFSYRSSISHPHLSRPRSVVWLNERSLFTATRTPPHCHHCRTSHIDARSLHITPYQLDDGRPFQFGRGVTNVAPWKVALIMGGIGVATVSGIALLASMAGPWVCGGIAVWLSWRTYKRWRIGYDAAGGASNPNNPFRHGPFTREARNAAFVMKRQEQLRNMFSSFNPAFASMFRGATGMNMQNDMNRANPFTGSSTSNRTLNTFLAHKMRATLLQQVLRHPSLRTVAALSATGQGARLSTTQSEVRPTSGGAMRGITLHVNTVDDVFSADSIQPAGVLTAEYVLRIGPEQLHELQFELEQFTSKGHIPDSPFDGPLFRCIQFQSVIWTPRHGIPIELTDDPQFRTYSSTGKSRTPVIQEAEFVERTPPKK